MMRLAKIILLTLPLALLPAAVKAAEFTDKQRAELGEIIREYLLKNPEVLLEVSRELEKRQQLAEEQQREQTMNLRAAEIFRSEADLVAGNPEGSVTMVEFFDYNCPWCKKSMPEVLALIEADDDVRFVMKEFPIFGEDSEYAARAALASRAQGKYWQFHQALLSHEGKLDKAGVDAIAVEQGLDLTKLKADMESPEIYAIVTRNQDLARDLGITGTPAFIVDKKVIPGYVQLNRLLAAVQEVRDGGGCQIC
jgi:protein-disulfide isomerase